MSDLEQLNAEAWRRRVPFIDCYGTSLRTIAPSLFREQMVMIQLMRGILQITAMPSFRDYSRDMVMAGGFYGS